LAGPIEIKPSEVFGPGWILGIPSITDKRLPHYQNGTEESDVFILSSAEDLVRALVQVGGQWRSDECCIAFRLVQVECEEPYVVDRN
jgi:hypothetical protein